jgi:hypothetical protein
MRSVLRLLSIGTVVLVCSAGPALAVTAQDLVKLHVAGLGDDILIALIAADESTFKLTAAEIIALRGQGLSERVLHAMITAGRPLPPQVVLRDRAPAGAVILYESAQAPAPAPAVPAPAQVVNVTQHVEQTVEAPRSEPQTVYVPVYVSVPVRPREPEKQPEPVYWGFGGQRRPDTWKDRK